MEQHHLPISVCSQEAVQQMFSLQEQSSALYFHWRSPSAGFGNLKKKKKHRCLVTALHTAHANAGQTAEVQHERVKTSGAARSRRALPPEPQGREREGGTFKLRPSVQRPRGNVWPGMTQHPTLHRRSGETRLRPKQFPDCPK